MTGNACKPQEGGERIEGEREWRKREKGKRDRREGERVGGGEGRGR